MERELLPSIAQGLDRGLLMVSDFDTDHEQCTTILIAQKDLSVALYRRDQGAVLRSELYNPGGPVLEINLTRHNPRDGYPYCAVFQQLPHTDVQRLGKLASDRADCLAHGTVMDEDACMRVWEHGPFRLELFESRCECTGKSEVAYRFSHDGRVIFVEDHLGVPARQTLDGDQTVRGALSTIALAPGDVDADYFSGYSPVQLAWCEEHAETLALTILEIFGEP